MMSAMSAVAPWDLSETQRLIDNPAVRLLRSPNCPLTLTFLHRAFKEHHAISVPESHMRARLENFLEEARMQQPGSYLQTAADYLAAWCGDEQLLLKKLYSDQVEEPVFELTSGAERVMQWIEDLQAKPFVSAESRLELILRNLEEIVLFSTSDVEKRLSALKEQQAAIQAQIDAMESSNTAEAYTPVQLTERFANALDLARGLTGDFRQLEENFKEVARSLAESHAQPGANKGRIVGQLLDTHAAIKDSTQGQSFYAFWNLLSSPQRQQRWRELTRQVYRIEAIDSSLRSNRLIDRLSSLLLVEGERVVRSNERMAATLRRALESAASGEDQRLRELIHEIQKAAIIARAHPPSEDEFFEFIATPAPFSSFSRSFWQPDSTGNLVDEFSFASDSVLDWSIVSRFKSLADLNLRRLRGHIHACLATNDSILLSDILRRFPVTDGALEIIGYLVIATQEDTHYVARDQFTSIRVAEGIQGTTWRVPEVLFARAG
jgi:hypothetical protein